MTHMDAARIIARTEDTIEKHLAEIARIVRIHEIELQAEKDRAEIRVDAAVQRAALFRRHLEEAAAWYRSPAFIATVAVVATVAAIITAGYVVGQAGAVAQ